MVQLKGGGTQNGTILCQAFQFLYGTIKSGRLQLSKPNETDFNSSMVQLKEVVSNSQTEEQPLFQFLYGTIKRQFSVAGGL